MKNKYLDLDLLNDVFEIIDGELWRKGGRVKKPILNQRCSIYHEDGTVGRFNTQRVIYAIQNNISEFDDLMLNDDGDYEPIPNSVKSLVAFSKDDKVCKFTPNRGWTARWTALDGTRPSKTFDTKEEAIEYQQEQTKLIWSAELKKHNMYEQYFK